MSHPSFTPIQETAILSDDVPLLNLFRNKSEWIWTKEYPEPPFARSNEQRAFRKTFTNTLAPNARPVNATVIIAVDNYYALYVNGAVLHPANPDDDYRIARVYNIPVYHDKLVFAVRAVNINDGSSENPAGVKAAIKIAYSDGSPSTMYYSGQDQTFLAQSIFGEGWEKPDFNDESWPPANIQNGEAFHDIWYDLIIPTKATHATIDASAFSQAQCPAVVKALKTGEVAGLAVGTFVLGALLAAVMTYLISRQRFLNRPVSPPPKTQPAPSQINQYLMTTPQDYSPTSSKVHQPIHTHPPIHKHPIPSPEYQE